MEKPVILAVDDDPIVAGAVARDLQVAYGEHYQIVRMESGRAALEAAQQLRLQNRVVSLFIADQRMPQMSGIEFLEQAIGLFPDAKRVLLTAYADTDAAIRAINTVHLDQYLLKPWHPPEQNFYPALDDLLADWLASFRPVFQGVRLLDHRWSPEGHLLRDFMARNHIPFRWLDVERHDEADPLLNALHPGQRQLPVVVFENGTVISRPTTGQIAEQVGLRTRSATPFYDLVIVGGGPAGLAAAVYGASEGLKVAIIECDAPGGQAGTSSHIDNYLGFPSGVSGAELSRRALMQARRFGAEMILTQHAVGLRVEAPYKFVKLSDGSEVSCLALVVASGVSYRKLETQGVDELTGAGVYYGAAMVEAVACANQDLYIVGGANSAGQGAMFLSQYARSVTLLCRGPLLGAGMSHYLIGQIHETPNIHVRPNTEVVGVKGEGHLSEISLRDMQTGRIEAAPASGLFIFIGAAPCTEWLRGVVERDEHGFLLTGRALLKAGRGPVGWQLGRDPYLLETSVPGVFAAGDVRADSVKRVAAAVGEGSIAVHFIHQYLANP
ncbi:FAD-dependent oxidoreductase [Paraburkholderia phymatum]|uniref:Response regulator receiver modulated FAD-dependent pyridine nucleotide-disulphide oxidoreductase n=1 Tax=Paraburkholderia phymatum (strain DSM 17167 / CIP 108236 / LMG 21445 / STM815) TaxID=391038 RepID=B2JQZ6_PARP8|nr:FAD-dependent oxidoreductase [Paraburkholderia phymatum]ACC73687.1 response regulator receiver modulated FAD-dependent pyridine nucleotide-disulphide oxidoreductase [Paraburkholderia phymatum STM815]